METYGTRDFVKPQLLAPVNFHGKRKREREMMSPIVTCRICSASTFLISQRFDHASSSTIEIRLVEFIPESRNERQVE